MTEGIEHMTKTITKTSKNTNCLEGVKCPKCGQEDLFKIAASVIGEVCDDGTEDQDGGYEWDQQAFCQCCECDHAGKLADFTIENWGKEREPTPPDLLIAAQALLGRWGKGNLSQPMQDLQKAVSAEQRKGC
jgi:hypothetical protein